MDWAASLENINYLAVLLGALAPFPIGFFWYSLKGFGKPWMKEVGLKQKDLESMDGMPMTYGGTAVLSLVASFFLAMVLNGNTSVVEGALFGAVISLGFAATSRGIHYLFEKKSSTLFAINAGYDVVSLAATGAIIAFVQSL